MLNMNYEYTTTMYEKEMSPYSSNAQEADKGTYHNCIFSANMINNILNRSWNIWTDIILLLNFFDPAG